MKNLAFPTTTTSAYSVSKLLLTNFRNYNSLSLNLTPAPVVLTGANGSGKTNILEAISFLSPGRGLRGIKLDEADRKKNQESRILENKNTRMPAYSNSRILDSNLLDSTSPWAIAAWINSPDEQLQIGTGRDGLSYANKRIVKIDGEVIRSQAELAQAFSVMWLTPQMDGLFLAAASERRKFLDRLVYNFNPEHASLVYSYEYSMRERARLLQDRGDTKWLDVLEAKMAEKSVAIAVARVDAINVIQDSINLSNGTFPKASLAIDGYVESLIGSAPALEIEEIIRNKIRNSREDDFRSGRTNIGTHRSDFCVTHIEKNMPAQFCSTGEQKALLLAIILAEARAKAAWKSTVPVLLLDEVVAHLDESRRSALFEEFLNMNAQVWMTGTDTSLFDGLQGKAQFLRVDDGRVF